MFITPFYYYCNYAHDSHSLPTIIFYVAALRLEAISGPHYLGGFRGDGGSGVGGRGLVLQNGAPDCRDHPTAGPLLGIGVFLKIVHRIAIVQAPNAVHQFAVILERRQLPTCIFSKKIIKFNKIK